MNFCNELVVAVGTDTHIFAVRTLGPKRCFEDKGPKFLGTTTADEGCKFSLMRP